MEQIGRITLVVQNLLDFARRREPRIELIDLARVIDGVAEVLEGEFARNGVEVAREGAPAAEIDGDPHLLHQVFTNLFMNAMQAMEAVDGLLPGGGGLVATVAGPYRITSSRSAERGTGSRSTVSRPPPVESAADGTPPRTATGAGRGGEAVTTPGGDGRAAPAVRR